MARAPFSRFSRGETAFSRGSKSNISQRKNAFSALMRPHFALASALPVECSLSLVGLINF
jgi:hypothetical protein